MSVCGYAQTPRSVFQWIEKISRIYNGICDSLYARHVLQPAFHQFPGSNVHHCICHVERAVGVYEIKGSVIVKNRPVKGHSLFRAYAQACSHRSIRPCRIRVNLKSHERAIRKDAVEWLDYLNIRVKI